MGDTTNINVKKGVNKKVDISADGTLSLLLPKSEAKQINQKINLKSDVTAPVKKGQVVGNVDIFVGDKSVGSIKIVADNHVKRLNLWITFKYIAAGLLKL